MPGRHCAACFPVDNKDFFQTVKSYLLCCKWHEKVLFEILAENNEDKLKSSSAGVYLDTDIIIYCV